LKSELLRFIFVGCLGFVVDAGLVLLLSEAGVSPILARIPALTFAIITTWILNRTLTFRVNSTRSSKEAWRYLVVALSAAILNFLFYTALVMADVRPVTAVAVSTIALLFCSFYGYRRFAFKLEMPKR
jgi:putative flippase GtrA